MIEFRSEFRDAFTLKIEVVHINIETVAVFYSEMLFGILQKERGFAYSSGTFNADKTVIPIDLVHKGATNRSVGMFHQVGMCSEESFHILYQYVLQR